MEKLGELKAIAVRFESHEVKTMPVYPEDILDIAEAFLAQEQRAEAAEHERDCHMDIAEHFKSRCKDLEQRDSASCQHQWNTLKLVECGGSYQYCTLCGAKKVAE